MLAANLASGTDLSSLDGVAPATTIKLRGSLFTNDVSVTPLLKDWSVGYSTR